MSRFIKIVAIFAVVTSAWAFIGGTIVPRAGDFILRHFAEEPAVFTIGLIVLFGLFTAIWVAARIVKTV